MPSDRPFKQRRTFGEILETTMDYAAAVQYAGHMSNLAMMARSAVRDIDPQNELALLLIRSEEREITAAPESGYYLIVSRNRKA
ncbi:UNVERIFIED_CONTAM: hypothetical protein H355_006007 [Colinus virginianus]|nr:hypothetical protein H355_006007 [Colinus virginianus]